MPQQSPLFRWPAAAGGLVLALSLAAPARADVVSLQSYSQAYQGAVPIGTPDIQTASFADVASLHRLDTAYGTAAGTAQAWIEAAAGVIHAFDDVQVLQLGASVMAGGTAIVVDTLHVGAPLLAIGTPVDLLLQLAFTVDYQFNLPANSMRAGTAASFSGNDGTASAVTTSDGPAIGTNGWGQQVDVLQAVLHTRVGADVTLDGRLQLNIQVDGVQGDGNHLMADASHSAHFYVSAPSGVVLTAASGHDYAPSPVPEPAPAALLVAGLAALALRRLSAQRRADRAACAR